MSGAEAIAVLGVISSIISIVDGTKKVYDAATNAQDLPEAFCTVAGRLPIVRNILGSAKQHIDKGGVDEDSCKGVKHVIDACEKKAKKLDTLFQKAIPKDGARGFERYCVAVKQLGKGNEVENLMTGMLEDIRGIKTANKAQQDQIVEAITELSAVPPSVPEHIFQETGFTNANHGSGAQDNAQGDYVAQGSARQFNAPSGTINIGSMENEAETCLSALFLTDPRDDREQLIQAKGSRVVGTCEWIKSNKLYDYWFRSRSQLLWLSGGPGKGKTMLSIFLAEELERTAKDSQDKLFLQYFCDNKDEKRKTAVTIIRGLIFQLLKSRQKLFVHILQDFKIQKESLFADSSFQTLWRIFESMVRDPILGTTYCVLDGLDECDEASLEVLLTKFADLFSENTNQSSVCHLNLIVVSRDLPDFIPELLSSFPRIRLDPDADTEISNDIDQFIEAKVNKLAVDKQYPESLRVHVKEVFQNRAQGTFLWVGIVAKALKKHKATAVNTALDLFPSGLDELYARMLLQIDIDRREIAAKILRWIVMAVRPLTLSELSIATDTTASPSGGFSRDEVMRDQLSYCGHFLTIREDKNKAGKDEDDKVKEEVVSLIHQSAKDYLLRKNHDLNPELEFFRIKEEVANLEIARKCLDYLQIQEGALGVMLWTINSHLRAFPLLSYAALHWPEHARSLAPSEDIFDLSLPFYHKKSRIRESWLKTYWAAKMDSRPPKSFTLLHLASYFGILPLAENLFRKSGLLNKMKRKLDLNKKDGRKRTALMWATQGEHEALVRLLLEKGVDLKAKDEDGWTALQRAANSGHKAMVRLLLEKGADIEATDEDGRTALHWAAKKGHDSLVWLLLEKGADLEAKDSGGQTALHAAAEKGHDSLVQLLLEKGADLEAKDRFGLTALERAVSSGRHAVVRLLLEKGADIEATGRYGRTALKMAAKSGHKAVVQLLLEKGADLEVKNSDGETALQMAASYEHEAVVRLLLEKGADLEAKDEDGRTALSAAASGGHEAVVRLLLEKGADIEATDRFGWTALCLAVWNGQVAVVQLLLEKGADFKAKNSKGVTALHAAARGGRKAVVQLLLEKGADLEAKDEDGRTALSAAVSGGHEAVVRLLLEKGADIEATDRFGWTALCLAVWNGQVAVVQLLLEKGADFKAKNSKGVTALHAAARGGRKAVVQLLLEKGADLEAKDSGGETALHAAAEKGHEAVVRLLLEKGADLEAKRSYGETVLHAAAAKGHEAVVRLLLEKGADLEAKNSKGVTALHAAARGGRKAVVQLLLEKGADLEAKDEDGRTALSAAASGGHEAVVRLLWEKGLDIEAKDKYGSTALSAAATGGHMAVVRLLWEKGADIEATNRSGRTALEIATKHGHKAVVRLLLEKGTDVEAKTSILKRRFGLKL